MNYSDFPSDPPALSLRLKALAVLGAAVGGLLTNGLWDQFGWAITIPSVVIWLAAWLVLKRPYMLALGLLAQPSRALASCLAGIAAGSLVVGAVQLNAGAAAMCGLGALVGETLDLKRALARYREQRGAHGRFAMIWSFTPLMLMLYVVTTPVRVVVAATLGGFFFPEGGSSVVAAFLLGLAVPRLLGWINAGGVPPVGPAGLLETPSIDVEIDNLRSRTSAGDLAARAELARVLSRRRSLDDLDDLRTLADAGEGQAAFALAELLGRRGSHEDREELRVRSEAGSRAAARQFAIVLATRGNRKDFEDLRNRANEGDGESAYQVGLILGRSKDADDLSDAIRLARVAATAEVSGSSVLLNRLLKSRTSVDDVQELRERAGNGDGEAAYILANILKDRGGGRDLDEAVLLMRSSADSGRRGDAASRLLAELLLRRRSPADVDELRARAYAGVLSDDFLISDKAREYRLLIAEADGLTGRSGTSAP